MYVGNDDLSKCVGNTRGIYEEFRFFITPLDKLVVNGWLEEGKLLSTMLVSNPPIIVNNMY